MSAEEIERLERIKLFDDLQESVSLFMFDYRTFWIFVMQESEEQILGRILNIIFTNIPVSYASMSLT